MHYLLTKRRVELFLKLETIENIEINKELKTKISEKNQISPIYQQIRMFKKKSIAPSAARESRTLTSFTDEGS